MYIILLHDIITFPCRAKHPTKVHVWAGVSWVGATQIVIFDGLMDAEGYSNVLRAGLLPFIREKLPTHKLMQDNDPKHTSRLVRGFMEDEGINWWKTPAESPDCNPIENMWHELKEYLRREIKPQTKSALVEGIQQFWRTVDVAKCRKYICHLRKVIPKVIELHGGPTGY